MDKILGYDGKEIKLQIIAPPGELLRKELSEREITQSDFSKRLGMRQPHFNDILQGKRKINARLAIKLEKELGISAEFWIGLEARYELAMEREKELLS